MHMLSFMQDCEAQTAYKTALDVALAGNDDSLVDWHFFFGSYLILSWQCCWIPAELL